MTREKDIFYRIFIPVLLLQFLYTLVLTSLAHLNHFWAEDIYYSFDTYMYALYFGLIPHFALVLFPDILKKYYHLDYLMLLALTLFYGLHVAVVSARFDFEINVYAFSFAILIGVLLTLGSILTKTDLTQLEAPVRVVVGLIFLVVTSSLMAVYNYYEEMPALMLVQSIFCTSFLLIILPLNVQVCWLAYQDRPRKFQIRDDYLSLKIAHMFCTYLLLYEFLLQDFQYTDETMYANNGHFIRIMIIPK